MKRLLVPAGLLVLAAVVGGAVAGRPTAIAHDVDVAALGAPTSTAAPSTTLAPPPSTALPTTTNTTTTPTTPPMTAARVVVADAGAGRAAAAAVAEDLRARGVRDVTVAVATAPHDTSEVLYERGFERQAIELIGLLGVSGGAGRPADAVTTLDEPGELWVLVGRDRS